MAFSKYNKTQLKDTGLDRLCLGKNIQNTPEDIHV